MITRVVVTGASGFIGYHVCERLIESGYRVKAISRQSSPSLAALGADAIAVGDMNLISDWRPLLSDAECIVHLAGRAGGQPDTSSALGRDYFRENIEITKSLVSGAKDSHVQQLIFMSSIKVFGDGPFTAPLKIADEPAPSGAYGQSKFDAEQWILGACGPRTPEPVIVRPPLVYGPMVRGNFLKLMDLVRSGMPLPLRSANNPRSFVNVWNLADVIVRLIKACGRVRGVWHVSDNEDCSTRKLIEEIGRYMGKPLHMFGLPQVLIEAGLTALGKRRVYQQLFGSLQLDVSSTVELLGWQPLVTLGEGLARTVSCFQKQMEQNR